MASRISNRILEYPWRRVLMRTSIAARVASAGRTWLPSVPPMLKAPVLRKQMSSRWSVPPSLVQLWEVTP
uniref:PAL2 n=1 Tax=Arundo donax TaxID=35708 RepID=A0A0A8Y780_ARUDO